EQVGKAFVQHYYQTFDTNRAGLSSLYQSESMFSWEGEKIQGAQAIVEKLQGLPFTQVAHHVTSLDCHPTSGNGVLVLVCGHLKIEADAAAPPLKYSQTFVLMPLP
ncbi:putative nuclear transport factor 2, partial [Baffinella frigidus]